MSDIAFSEYCQCLSDLGANLQIEGLAPDDEGLCLLQIAADLFVELEFDPETSDLLMSAELGRIGQAHLPDWYPALLHANAFWCGTNGATLGLHEATGAVILCLREPVRGLTGELLIGLFERFTQTAEDWHQRLLCVPESTTAGDSSLPDMLHMLEHRV